MADVWGFAGKTAYILGLGTSGLATARALQTAGVRVAVWDDTAAARTHAADEGFFVQDPAHVNWASVGALVKSPGIAMTHPVPSAARQAGVDVLGDVDLFWLARVGAGSKFLGITGTNGKSTTTALVGHILQAAGLNVAVGGNIGVPLFDLPEADVYVLELSSYQLETLRHMQLDGGIFLNLTQDHLERHGTMGVYLATKLKLLKAVKPGGPKVIGIDTEPTRAYAAEHPAGLTTVSVAGQASSGFNNLPGPHNAQNIACARALVAPFVPAGFDVEAAIRSFKGLPHRMELVGTLRGVQFVNDSKATNGDSAVPALQSFTNIYWLCGGKPKTDGLGATLSSLGNVRGAWCLGQAGPAFAAELTARGVPAHVVPSLAEAVPAAAAAAFADGLPAACVLLSPACASQDQYQNFEERGAHFVWLVEGLEQEARA